MEDGIAARTEGVRLFGRTWVAPWSRLAGGFGQTAGAYAGALGRTLGGVSGGAAHGGWAGALTGAGAGAVVGLLVGPGGAAAGASGGFLAGGVSGIIWGGLEGFIAAAAEDELAGVAEGASKNGLKAGAVAGLAAGAGKALGKAIEKGVGLTFWQRQMGAGGTLTLERIIVHCPPALAAAVNGVTIVAQGGLVVLMKKMSDGELKMPEEGKKHNHHTVPNEIREKLPEHLRNDPDFETTIPIDAKKHL